MTNAQLQDPLVQAMIDQAAEAGARRALASVGLQDEGAGKDLAEMRDALAMWRDVKRSVLKTVATTVTVGVLGLLATGFALRAWKE